MMVFKSHNLLGDGLNIYPALNAWHKLHPNEDIYMDVIPDYTQDIYTKMGLPVTIGKPDGRIWDFDFDVGKAFTLGHQLQLHITHAYANMLNVHIGEQADPNSYKLRYEPVEEPHEKDLVLVSMFSRSCSSRDGHAPNKMIPESKMAYVIDYLRSTVGEIGILGAEGDRATSLEISEDEYYTGLPLNKVALMLRDCRMLLTIDNGLSHLAATQQTLSVLLYPACLSPTWILPFGNLNCGAIQIDPALVTVPALLSGIDRLVKSTKSITARL